MNSLQLLFRRHWRILASVFLIYHVFAITIAPAPDSYLKRKLIPYFEPYLKIFRLNNYWAYFAPDPASGILMRYRLQNQKGDVRVFRLTETLTRSAPNFLRYTSLFNKFPDANSEQQQSAADYLCKTHQEFNPVSLQFIEGHQIRISPWDWNRSHRPLDNDYMKLKFHDWQNCE